MYAPCSANSCHCGRCDPEVSRSARDVKASQDEELIRLFSDGTADPELAEAVTAVRVVRDRATNVGKGVAYVEVSTGQCPPKHRQNGSRKVSLTLHMSQYSSGKLSALFALMLSAPSVLCHMYKQMRMPQWCIVGIVISND